MLEPIDYWLEKIMKLLWQWMLMTRWKKMILRSKKLMSDEVVGCLAQMEFCFVSCFFCSTAIALVERIHIYINVNTDLLTVLFIKIDWLRSWGRTSYLNIQFRFFSISEFGFSTWSVSKFRWVPLHESTTRSLWSNLYLPDSYLNYVLHTHNIYIYIMYHILPF